MDDEPKSLEKEVLDAIRKEAIVQAGKWTIATFAALFAIAASGWMFYIKEKADDYIISKAEGLPEGAVVAFDRRGGCSKLGNSWEDAGFGGRFLIGADDNNQKFRYRVPNGHEAVTLTSANMPRIYLGVVGKNFGNNNSAAHPISIGFERPDAAPNEIIKGGNENPAPVEIYPPYMPLYFCRKAK